MKEKNINKKGFTLIELLVVIAILALVLSITIYSITGVVKKARENTYKVTINEVEKAATDYLDENSDEIFFIDDITNNNQYQCVAIKELIEYGFLNKDVLKSNISNDELVDINDYVYIERNLSTKTIQKNKYFHNNNLNNMCVGIANSSASIAIKSFPSAWSKGKKITIIYDIRRNINANDYEYSYEFLNLDEKVIISDRNSMSYKLTKVIDKDERNNYIINEEGTIYGSIYYEDKSIANHSYKISNIDVSGPVISTTSENKYISKEVTIPLYVNDCDDEEKKCSGLNDTVLQSNELLNDILNKKIMVKVGENIISNNNLTLTRVKKGIYNLKIINNDYNGKVSIKVFENTFVDKVVDEIPNGNKETELNTNIIFDNVRPEIFTNSTSTLLASSQYAYLKCSDDNGINEYYIGKSNPDSNTNYTTTDGHNIFETNSKISSIGTYYFSCKDNAGNVSTSIIKYWNYSFKYMLNKFDKDEGVYSTVNYDIVTTTSNYLLPGGTTINFDDIVKQVPNGSNSNKYIGVSLGTPTTNATTLLSSSVIINNNFVYSFWYNRNKVKLQYNMNGGNLIDPHGVNYDYDSLGYILHNGSRIVQTLKYGGKTGENGLINFNNSNYVNIKREGYGIISNKEWNNNANGNGISYSQEDVYDSIEFCDAVVDDCTVTLYANWIDNVAPIIEFKLLNSSNVVQDSKYYYDENGTDSDWFNFTPKLWFKVTDSGSGVDKSVRFNWNEVNNSLLNENIAGGGNYSLDENYIKEIPIESIGYRYVEFVTKDNSGNSTTKKIFFKYDNVKPICKMTGLKNITKGEIIKVSVTCTDNFTNITNKTLTASDFIISNTISIDSVTKIGEVTNGYIYSVDIKGKSFGSYTIGIKSNLFSDLAGNQNETVTSSTYSVIISDAVCPTLTSYTGTYDGNSHTIGVSGGSGGTIQYRTSTTGTWSNTKPTRKDVGTTTVYVQVAGDSNHNTVVCGSSTITIKQASNPCDVTTIEKPDIIIPSFQMQSGSSCGSFSNDDLTDFCNASLNFQAKIVNKSSTRSMRLTAAFYETKPGVNTYPKNAGETVSGSTAYKWLRCSSPSADSCYNGQYLNGKPTYYTYLVVCAKLEKNSCSAEYFCKWKKAGDKTLHNGHGY